MPPSFSHDEALNLAVQPLDEQMRREAEKSLFISRFMGNVTSAERQDNMPVFTPSGAIIEVCEMKNARGIGDCMLIPMDMDLAGDATYGDSVLEGREESRATYYTRVYYNQVRAAVVDVEGEMSASRGSILDTLKLSIPSMSRWHAQMENWQFISSVYEGVSENLSTSKTDKTYGAGLGIAKRYHPNTYYWSGQTTGSLTRVGTADKFPTMAEMNTACTAATYTLSMTSTTLDALAIQCILLGIRKVVVADGLDFWPLFISPLQMKSLMQDTAFRTVVGTGMWTNFKQNPLVSGAVGYYGGFVIWMDPVGIRGFHCVDATHVDILGTVAQQATKSKKRNPRFLPMTGASASGGTGQNGGVNQAAIVLGASAFGKALCDTLQFRQREEDYGNWKGVAGVQRYGYNRMDLVSQADIPNLATTPSTISNIDNKSSMICITWQV